ncbi:MAG: DMT family transporter [bacterium]|nr:DMT family transporter [bacterium]MDE0601527.1 DMT family transporter [bacterium]
MFGHKTPIRNGLGPAAFGESGRWFAFTHNPWIPIMIASLAWGSAPAANRAILLLGVNPFTIFPLKQTIGTAVIVTTLALTRRNLRMDRETLVAGAAIGVFNMTVPTILFTLGFLVIPASIGAVIVGIIPLTTILLTHWVVPGETFRMARLPGLALAIAGIAVMGWAPVGEPSSRWILGVVLMTVGSISAGLGGALTRRYAVRHRNAPLIVSQYLTSTVILGLLSIPFGGYQGYLTIDTTALWLIVYMGAVPTAVSFAAFMWASRITTAARAALTGYFSPLLGVTLGVALLSEPVTPQLIVGMGAVALGIVVSDRPDRQDDRRRAASAGPPAAG